MTVEQQEAIRLEDIVLEEDEIDLSQLDKKYESLLNGGDAEEAQVLDSILVVDNLPVVDEARESKLLAVLTKQFSKFGKLGAGGITMPMAEDEAKGGKKMSKGFAFVEFASGDVASQAVKSIDGLRLDAKHTFTAAKLTDFDKIMDTPDVYTAPVEEPYKEKEQLNSWLMDAQARDQLATLVGEETCIYWNSAHISAIDPIHARNNWTENIFKWSPQGTYLATMHKQGIALWGGKSWERMARFVHPYVRLLDFSAKESYLTTWSPESSTQKDDNLRIWDIKTGKLLRAFKVEDSALKYDGANFKNWPLFKYSTSTENYVAKLNDKSDLEVFELPRMTSDTLKLGKVHDFAWRPGHDELAYWVPEDKNIPAKIAVVDVRSKSVIRTKNLFLVADLQMHWQSEGKFMAAQVERFTKTKKSTFTNIELFDMTEKGVPVLVYEGLKDKSIISLAFEPTGNHFVMLSTDGSRTFYTVAKVQQDIKEVHTEERKSASMVKWSPNGRFFVVGALKSTGEFDIYDVEGGDLSMPLCTCSHFNASSVEFDPSGRYLLSLVSYFNIVSENGFIIWNMKGEIVSKNVLPKCKMAEWRPRPPSMLSAEQIKDIKKNLSKYSQKYDEQDKKFQSGMDLRARQHRATLRSEWLAWRAECAKWALQTKDEHVKLLGDNAKSDQDSGAEQLEQYEEEVEEIVEETVEVVKDSE
ncbi:hypothetical protein MP228_006619 [Amoeboaphelidium protococcarum]|nr:hypothetical protein MP228_006619 [Amoeboaphelidium protococcarum]